MCHLPTYASEGRLLKSGQHTDSLRTNSHRHNRRELSSKTPLMPVKSSECPRTVRTPRASWRSTELGFPRLSDELLKFNRNYSSNLARCSSSHSRSRGMTTYGAVAEYRITHPNRSPGSAVGGSSISVSVAVEFMHP